MNKIILIGLISACSLLHVVTHTNLNNIAHAVIPTDYNSNIGFNQEYHGQIYTYANSICFNEDCSKQIVLSVRE